MQQNPDHTIRITSAEPTREGELVLSCQVAGGRFDLIVPASCSRKGIARRVRQAAQRAGLVPAGVCATVLSSEALS
jgi:hypothetical protein